MGWPLTPTVTPFTSTTTPQSPVALWANTTVPGMRYVPGTVTVKVPLVGGKLEKLMADRIRAGMDAEHGVGVTWLEANR